MELKGKTINFLGDSITAGSGASNKKLCFVEQFKKITKIKKVNNYGIGGTRIARVTVPSAHADWDKDFVGRFTEMDRNADIVVVFGGTNDYGHGDARLGTFESRDVHTFYGACHTLMCGLTEMYVGKTVVFMTPLHRENEFTKDKNGHILKEYVKVIKEVAEYYSIPVLDLYAMSGIQPEIPVVKERLMPDGLHPNDAGHLILAEKVKGFLEAL